MKGPLLYLLFILSLLQVQPLLKAQDQSVESGMLRSKYYREQFQLFTDRDIYTTYERIFFRAYNLSKPQLKQINWSRVLYVELIGESNRAITRGKFELNSKGTWGCLTIPSNIATGIYSIRAYTKWMRNYPPEGYFHKSIVIINPGSGWIDQLPVKNGSEILSPQGIPGDSKNRVLCATDKQVYGTREKIRVTLSLPEINNPSPDGYCVSVVRKGHCNTTIPETNRHSFTEQELPDTIRYYPETRGVSLSGKITTGDGVQPIPFARIHMTLLGNATDYYGSRSDENGIFRIALPDHARSKDVLFCVERENDQPVMLTLDDGYSKTFVIEKPEPSVTTFMDKKIAEEVFFAGRLNRVFNSSTETNDTINSVDKPDYTFYGYPSIRFNPSDYVALPNLEEFFYELIRHVDIRKEKGKHYFRLIGLHPDLRLFDPLILLDFVPVYNIEQVLTLNPAKVSHIDIINWVYIRGDQRYGGILSIITNRGDRAGVELPRNSFFFPFSTYESMEDFVFPDYDRDPGEVRTPDYRNCLYWTSDLSLLQGESVNFDLFTPDNAGEYIIIVRGITGEGEVVQGECEFTVE